MPLIDDIHENRLLSRWAELLPRPATAIGSIHEADAELVPLDETRWLAVKVDTVAEEIAAGLYTDRGTHRRYLGTLRPGCRRRRTGRAPAVGGTASRQRRGGAGARSGGGACRL